MYICLHIDFNEEQFREGPVRHAMKDFRVYTAYTQEDSYENIVIVLYVYTHTKFQTIKRRTITNELKGNHITCRVSNCLALSTQSPSKKLPA